MSATQMTGEEMFDSLTGYDEVAVGTHFGEVGQLAQTKPTMFLRAMVFVHLTREGKNAKEAKAEAMGMSLKVCNDYFAEDAEEPMPDEPVTPVGEGDSLPD